MKNIHLSALAILPLLLAACASQGGGGSYDTQPGSSQATSAPAPNPVYDSQAAYEDNTEPSEPSAPAINPDPTIADPSTTSAYAPASPAPTSHAPGRTHTVVRGDTLSGLADKYNVPKASIKAANHMTSDTVFLGRTMIIPAR